MSVAPNPADPRVRRTRHLLQSAFMELLEQRGFESITVQDIAERATVNRATFYAHFEDKYALLDSMIHEQFHRALEESLSRPAALRPLRVSALNALAGVVFEVMGQMDGHCRPTDQHVKPLLESALQRELKQTLLDWLRWREPGASGQGAPPAQPDTIDQIDLAATVMSWALFGAAAQWSLASRRPPLEYATRQAVDMLLAGVSRTLDVTLPA